MWLVLAIDNKIGFLWDIFGRAHDTIRKANSPFPSSHNNMKHLLFFFFFFFTAVAFATASRCPNVPKTHCASLQNDVTCSGWSHKVPLLLHSCS